jgi:lambda family phage portal protein
LRPEIEQPKETALDKAISYISPNWALSRAEKRFRIELSQYRSADITQLRSSWLIFNESDATTPDLFELNNLRQRSRDAIRNDPVAAGAQDTLKINIVGTGLRPQSAIRAGILGVSEERAERLRNQAEVAFEKWKPFADAANRLDFDEMQFIALAKIIEDGEIIGIPTWANEGWRTYGRCLELLEADRLKTPSHLSAKVKHGVETGGRGQPIAYHLTKTGTKGIDKTEFNRVAARDKSGRPKVLHVFPSRRPGQMRGIPFFAPILTYFKDLADYLEAEIVAARVAACLAVFITKSDPMSAALTMGTTDTTGANRYQSLEPGMIGYLQPGEAINSISPNRPGDTFAPFVEQLLRMIGVSLQLPYELLVKDFSKTNYSSARASLLEGRRSFTTWRKWFARKFCGPVWDLILEEAYLRGDFDAPDFYKYREEYARVFWIGGGWGWVDPVKEVEASKAAISGNLSTLAEEAAGQGRDWEEILLQRKRERDMTSDLNLRDVADEENNGGNENAESEEK